MATTVRRGASVLATRSVSLAPVRFAVKPGNSYQLTVAIAVPAGQTVAGGTSFSEVLQIAPAPDQRGVAGGVHRTLVGAVSTAAHLGS